MNDAFARWLARATADLTPAQRTRVAAELTNHYHDAVDAYCAQGYPSAAAARLALADLGDPSTTAHAFAATGFLPWRLVRRSVRRCIGATGGRFILTLVAFSLPLGSFLIGADRHATVVLLQTALLALILCIPLYFDDLDLSLGVVALMGTLVAQLPAAMLVNVHDELLAGRHLVPPYRVGSVVMIAALLGGLIGLTHGLLAGILRRPLAQISAVSAVGLALLLQPFRARHQSVWSVYPHWLDETIGAPPVLYAHERGTVAGMTGALFAAVVLLVVSAAYVAPDTRGDDERHQTRPRSRSSRQRHLSLVVAGAGVLPVVLFLATLNRAPFFHPFVAILAVLICAAMVTIGDGLERTRGRRWLLGHAAQRGHGSVGSGSVRVLRLVGCSALAGSTGALITAQGMRDNTYHFAASFLIIVPLASLLVGGQHVLRGPYRLLGGIAGILVVASLTSRPDDYKLNDDSVIAVLLAALGVALWRWILRPQLRAAAPVDPDAVRGEQSVHFDVDLA